MTVTIVARGRGLAPARSPGSKNHGATMTTDMLFGRDAERARIGELLDGARESRSGVLVLRGEAGAGKTALLEEAREQAADMLVLSGGGIESEAELPFAALHQLAAPDSRADGRASRSAGGRAAAGSRPRGRRRR